MVTVQQVVRSELGSNPILLDMLQQDLLNVSALAERFHPKISITLRREVKLSAISMAIRRVSEEFSALKLFKWEFPTDLEVSTKANIYEVAVKRESRLPELLPPFRKAASKKTGTFLSVVDGTYETVFLTNQSNKPILKSLLKGREIISERDNLSYVSVNFEPPTKEIHGIYYQITRALALNNISIQSFHTLGAEMVILFDNNDLLKAYGILTRLISGKPIL